MRWRCIIQTARPFVETTYKWPSWKSCSLLGCQDVGSHQLPRENVYCYTEKCLGQSTVTLEVLCFLVHHRNWPCIPNNNITKKGILLKRNTMWFWRRRSKTSSLPLSSAYWYGIRQSTPITTPCVPFTLRRRTRWRSRTSYYGPFTLMVSQCGVRIERFLPCQFPCDYITDYHVNRSSQRMGTNG